MTEAFKFKPMDIKGKKYVSVAERLRYLKEVVKDYSLTSTWHNIPEKKLWIVQATLKIGNNIYTGLAQEIESDNFKDVNYSSFLENCESSAWGRACAAAGIGLTDSVASVDEMTKAANRQTGKNPHWQYMGKTKDGEDLVSGDFQGRKWFARVDKNGERTYYKEKNDWLADMKTDLTIDPLPEFPDFPRV
jgi:predicted ATP-grasp superfamily ATP-dependent carboligase